MMSNITESSKRKGFGFCDLGFYLFNSEIGDHFPKQGKALKSVSTALRDWTDGEEADHSLKNIFPQKESNSEGHWQRANKDAGSFFWQAGHEGLLVVDELASYLILQVACWILTEFISY